MNAKAKVACCCFGKTFNGILFLTNVFYCKFFSYKKVNVFIEISHIINDYR